VKKIKAILADDEDSARDILENLLKRFCPEVELLGKYANLPDTVAGIAMHQPDLVFLDIEMPNYAGFEIVDLVEDINFEIVFITAYDHYALKAFEIAATDYLLKPIDIHRLKEAIERVTNKINAGHQKEKLSLLSQTIQSRKLTSIIIPYRGSQHIINITEIIAIEAHESYCEIHLAQKSFIASKNLRHFESILEPDASFFRVHKSWLINCSAIENYSKSTHTIQLKNGLIAKLSKYRKSEFERILERP